MVISGAFESASKVRVCFFPFRICFILFSL